MSIIALGGGDLNNKIFNKIITLSQPKRTRNLYIGLITDASFITHSANIKKIINGFNYQQQMFPTLNFIIKDIKLINYKNKKHELVRFIKMNNILFFTGGHQQNIYNNIIYLKRYNIFVKKYLIEFLENNGTLVGTSAGASILGSYMPPNLGKGLGLVNTIIDQHFIENRRFNRGLKFVKEKPKLGLIGLDEDAMIIHKYKNAKNSKRFYKVFGNNLVIIIENNKSKINVKVLKNNDSFYI
jgi:cyanophycinase-like exopeptidase